MPDIDDIKIRITADDKASAVFKSLGDRLGGFGSALGSVARFAGAGAVAAFGALTAASVKSLEAFGEQDKAVKQLEAVLKSTGNAAGLFKEDILEQAAALQKLTTYSDESILSAQNLLLTFTNIKGATFQQATDAVLNMSTALGQDLKSSAIQVGKALQDPILGVTALRRVGVNFNEEQTKMIQNLVETGRAMEAQQFILKELNVEFGGSAVKAAESYQGKLMQMQNAMNELQETFGAALAEAITPFIGTLTEWASKPETQEKLAEIARGLAQFVEQMGPIIVEVLPAFIKIMEVAANVVVKVSKFLFEDLAGALGEVIFQIMKAIEWVENMVQAFNNAIGTIRSFFSKLSEYGVGGASNPITRMMSFGIPTKQAGGVVPGPFLGAAVPILAHAGEEVVPIGGRQRSGGGGVTVNIHNPLFLDRSSVQRVADQLIMLLKEQVRI